MFVSARTAWVKEKENTYHFVWGFPYRRDLEHPNGGHPHTKYFYWLFGLLLAQQKFLDKAFPTKGSHFFFMKN